MGEIDGKIEEEKQSLELLLFDVFQKEKLKLLYQYEVESNFILKFREHK